MTQEKAVKGKVQNGKVNGKVQNLTIKEIWGQLGLEGNEILNAKKERKEKVKKIAGRIC